MSEVEGLYGEGRAMLTRFGPGTCACGESITTRPECGVRGENRGKLSGSIERLLVCGPAGLEEIVC